MIRNYVLFLVQKSSCGVHHYNLKRMSFFFHQKMKESKTNAIYQIFAITVKSLFVAAATIGFDEIFRQNLLSKNCFLLRPLFKGGYYLRAATNKDFTVFANWHVLRFLKQSFDSFELKSVNSAMNCQQFYLKNYFSEIASPCFFFVL